VNPSRLPPPGSYLPIGRPGAFFGADVPTDTTPSWSTKPLTFFATLGAGIVVGYLIGKK
jgi:hypothetical protein